MDRSYIGRSLENFLPGVESKEITRVELLDESGNIIGAAGEAGDGHILTALNPDGTDAMAAHILGIVGGYAHMGYEGRGTLIDPAVELGDMLSVDGHEVPFVRESTVFDALYRTEISAPNADEIEDEYPWTDPTQKKIERSLAQTRSLIAKTSEAITLKVEDLGNTVDGVDQKYTELKVTLDGVTITDKSGTTKIKGSSIETDTLYVKAANITGTLTIGQLPDGVAQKSDIPTIPDVPTKISELMNDSSFVVNDTGVTGDGITSITKGIVTTEYVNALGVYASYLLGDTIFVKYLSDETETLSGQITTNATTTGGGLGIHSAAGLRLTAGVSSNVFIASNSSGGATPTEGGFIQIEKNAVKLQGGLLVLGSKMFGTTDPTINSNLTEAEDGTVYFQKVS